MDWDLIIGLEVHVQLKTKSKIFSGSATQYGREPNTQASIIDIGLPGTLPVFNKAALHMAAKFGLAIGANVADICVFDRKNYSYPDLPKGYQITQLQYPIVKGGTITINLEDGTHKVINITRAHLEEDAGKSLHEDFSGMTGIDLNRAGTPLIEIVSEPEMHSAKEAVAYLKALHTMVRYLDICDGNMQEGSFRCDVNISVKPKGDNKLGTRTELKNLNSFKFIEKAIAYEQERQIDLLESGQSILQETRLYDSQKNETRSLRNKESENDYRYFPDPDLLPVVLEPEVLEEIRESLPELPAAKQQRFVNEFKISEIDANLLTANKELADFFEQAIKAARDSEPKIIANWVISEILGALNKQNLTILECPISPANLGKLVSRITDKTISGKIAKTVFDAMFKGEHHSDPDKIIEAKGLKQVTDSSEILKIVEQVIDDNPKQVADYLAGKDKIFGFFVGQVMKISKGKANPEQVNQLLKDKLK